MDRHEIVRDLIHQHSLFIRTIRTMPEDVALRAVDVKWSPAQQLDHLVRSVSPVRMAFSLPTLALKIKFGIAHRPSRTYDDLVATYHTKLRAGGKASGSFLPDETAGSVTNNAEKLQYLVNSLCKKIESFSEAQLDRYVLPHPLLDKLTLREMLYFTLYHVQHHHAQITNHDVG